MADRPAGDRPLLRPFLVVATALACFAFLCIFPEKEPKLSKARVASRVDMVATFPMATRIRDGPCSVHPSDPPLAGNCQNYTFNADHCSAADCGMCFNPGARPGVMCKGNQPGYNCPSDHQGPDVGMAYACMDWTFGSTAMLAAEKRYNCRSGRNPVYFGVGTYGLKGDKMHGLGMCVQMQVEGVDREIIAQSINTGFDVTGNQFDLQIGAGGTGAYNTCSGGKGSMFPGSKELWGKQYGGPENLTQCAYLPSFPREDTAMKAAGDDLVKLCEYGFESGVRGNSEDDENPSILSVARVACPRELVNLTQLQRTDEPAEMSQEGTSVRRLKAAHKCKPGGTGTGLAWCLTRMMDCRKPSGGFRDNIHEKLVAPGRKLVQPCTADGYTRIDVQCGCPDCYC